MSDSEIDSSKEDQPLYASAGMAASGLFKPVRRMATSRSEAASEEEEEKPAKSEPAQNSSSIQADEPSSDESLEQSSGPAPEEPAPEPEYNGIRVAIFTDATADSELEKVFQRLEGTRIDAVQAEDEELANQAQVRSGARKLYTDSETLFKNENIRVSIVSCGAIATREKALMEAVTNGSHVLAALPIASNLKVSGKLLAKMRTAKKCILPILPLRHHPDVQAFRERYKSLVGEIIEIAIEGEQGPRAGGEDLLIHGLHGLDLIRWFGGDPEYCDAQIIEKGAPPLSDEARLGGIEGNLGPVVGECIRAQFVLGSGIMASFSSDHRLPVNATGPSALITGTKAKMLIRWSKDEVKLFLLRPAEAVDGFLEKAIPWPPRKENNEINERPLSLIVDDFLNMIEQDEPANLPTENATKALEMAHSIWQAGTSTKRAFFPLANPLHPLHLAKEEEQIEPSNEAPEPT